MVVGPHQQAVVCVVLIDRIENYPNATLQCHATVNIAYRMELKCHKIIKTNVSVNGAAGYDTLASWSGSAASVQRLVLAVSFFRLLLVLVLSIAVLVLVLECVFGNRLTSLDQSSQHRDDPFQV